MFNGSLANYVIISHKETEKDGDFTEVYSFGDYESAVDFYNEVFNDIFNNRDFYIKGSFVRFLEFDRFCSFEYEVIREDKEF